MKTVFIVMMIIISARAQAQQLKTNLMPFTNSTPEDEARVNRALKLIETVVNSPEFKQKVQDMKYQIGQYSYSGFSQTNYTPAEVLTSIFKGVENYSGGSESVMDLHLDMYYEVSDIIGYTNPWDQFIHMNRYFHQDYTPALAARNLFHEWLHKLNFDHSSRDNSYRPHSVPYKLGQVVLEMASAIDSKGDPVLKALYMDEDYPCLHE